MNGVIRTERAAVLVLLAPVILTGCAGRHFGPQEEPYRGRVVLFRGLWDVFSLGLDDLGEKAASEGYDVQIARSHTWPDAAASETTARLASSTNGPLIVGGHSYGADNAIRYCRLLEEEGLEVDLLLLLDATTPPPIPPNVTRCVHYYRTTILGSLAPFIFAGNPVEPAEGNSRTEIVNALLTPDLLGLASNSVGHFNIDASDDVHDLCLREINRVYLEKRGTVSVRPR